MSDPWHFVFLCTPDGTRWLTYKSPCTSFQNAAYDGVRYLSNLTGAWEPIESFYFHDATAAILTHRQVVELVGKDPVRWLEKGPEEWKKT